ncbi:hypothetical protein PCL_11966 [Purpureocillium lilacinum]|uniref:Amino acid permease/ SLC12A domain-containing protein n=1 Tax=Purpureocillium lilacinum TaxID=33203 RepID=A0A2U3EBK6_PURLI|nr:hypothetical protein PCL_11966 [Purpureocillium lilacinum]
MMSESFSKEQDVENTAISMSEQGRSATPEASRTGVASHERHIKRGLTSRHGQLIAWGGTVGTGLFITTGRTLAIGGPAFLVGSYVILAIATYLILVLVTEMAMYLPVRGASMSFYGGRFVSKSLGFTMGWLYVYSFAIFVPFELTASALVVGFWNTGVSNGVWITIFLLPLVGLNLLPVRFYGEAEFFFAGIKLATIIGLLVLSFILFWGGGPNHVRLGFHYWMHPGATKTQILEGDAGRLIAAIATIIASALPFTFTPEMVVITSGELQSPRRNLPKVSLNFNWRLVVFYVGSVVGISVVCPHNAIAFGGSTGASSPWVVAIRNAGIQSLPSVINTVIIIAAWSTGNAFLYLSSRCLYSLAVEGHAPKIFTKCTAAGTPIYAVGATSLPTLLAYLNLNSAAANVFNWLLNLVNTAGFISWVCCGIIYIRFHQARKEQGDMQSTTKTTLKEISACATAVFYVILTLLNGFTIFFPSKWSTADFLSAYIGLPIFFAVYLGHRFICRQDPWIIPLKEVKLQANGAELNEETEDELEETTESTGLPGTWAQRLRRIARPQQHAE